MLSDNLTRFVELTERRKALEESLDAVKKIAAAVEKSLLDDFERAGVSSAKVNGTTVCLHRTMAVRPKADRLAVCAALRAAGLGDYVSVEATYNTNSLTAYVKEQEKNGEPIPECLRETLELTELFFVRTRKSA